ncbi:MAG: peptidoglycan DD-metalloendopeptidase family protein, partial [Bacteroidota bacterium]
NYMLYDEELNLLQGGFVQISSAAVGSLEELSIPGIEVTQVGYLMAYVSNESDMASFVSFDDFSVTHTTSGVKQTQDYYPFGLTFHEWTREPENLYKYNGKEEQKEMGWYHYGVRYYDPVLARWHVHDPYAGIMKAYSPYAYAFNNPVKFEDKDGYIPWPKIFGEKRTAVLTSAFGFRTHPVTGETNKFHNGADLYAPEGTQVRSLAGGKVLRIGSNKISGNFVVVDHGYGFVTKYAHLKDVQVKKGSKVYDGMQIGTVGKTGRATGPHTHLMLEVNGVEADPTSIKDLQEKINDIESAQGMIEYLQEQLESRSQEAKEDGEVESWEQSGLDTLMQWIEEYKKELEDAMSTGGDENNEEEEDSEDEDNDQ